MEEFYRLYNCLTVQNRLSNLTRANKVLFYKAHIIFNQVNKCIKIINLLLNLVLSSRVRKRINFVVDFLFLLFENIKK